MKRAIAVIVIVLLMLGIGVWELSQVQAFIHTVTAEVEQIDQNFPSTESNITFLTPNLLTLQQHWEKNENWLCMLHNHKDLSVLTNTINELSVAVEENNYFDAKTNLNLLTTQTKKLPHTMTFSIQNIF